MSDNGEGKDKELDLFSKKLVKSIKEDIIPSEDVTQDVINLLLEGKSRADIKASMPYDAVTIANYIKKAESEIASISAVDVDSIIAAHVGFYERLYNFALERGYTSGQLKAMRQKEDLLVLSNEVNEIRIINETEAILENKEDYNFTQLLDEERNQLIKLLDKVK